jgi:hypothetical protein
VSDSGWWEYPIKYVRTEGDVGAQIDLGDRVYDREGNELYIYDYSINGICVAKSNNRKKWVKPERVGLQLVGGKEEMKEFINKARRVYYRHQLDLLNKE